MSNQYILSWRYTDYSGFGVIPRIFTEYDKKLIDYLSEVVGFEKEIVFTQVTEGNPAIERAEGE